MSPNAAIIVEPQVAGAEVADLPSGWSWSRLDGVAAINPPTAFDGLVDDAEIPFVPMAAVSEETGTIDVSRRRPLSEVRSGFVRFREGDVIFAKITPCMENGKTAPAIGIPGSCAAGSTEFHVLRPVAVETRYLWYWLVRHVFRRNAERNMSGSAGQLRVPVGYLRQTVMPVAPTAEQRRIVARVDELFAEIAEGEAALRRARKGLDTWRRALLKAAVTGELTRDWREAHRPKETGSQLLDRIKATRGNSIRQSTRQHLTPDIPIEPSDSLPEIPEGWCWVNWGAVGISQNGRAFPSQEYCDSGVKLLRPGNLFSDGSIRWTNQNTRYLPDNFLSANRDLIVTEYELVINLTAQSLKDEFLGRVCFTSAGEFCLLNQRLARLTPIVISSEFMLLVFKSAIFRRFVSKLNTGSLIQHMFTSQINRFVFPLPPKEEQEVIVTKLNVGLGGIAELEAIIDDQRNTALLSRQSILKAAFEGRLVPQDADGEPASMLLARSRENAPPQTTARRRGQRIAPPQPSLPGLSNGSTQARRQ